MESITDIIEPIKLLAGSHADTAKTGSGCFMNVISYLNGEPQITDQSACVCVTVRKIAIWLNDFLRDDERHEMIPFIERAMGSATDDRDEMNRRLKLMVTFAERQRDIAAAAAADAAADAAAATYAANAATYAANAAATYAANAYAAAADAAAATYAANAATYATTYAAYYAEFRAQIKSASFDYLDAVLPRPCNPGAAVLSRAKALIALTA
jgi:hypothetical protein